MTLHNPNFPDGLAEGTLDPRNVIDYYKAWETSEIAADLAATSMSLTAVAENFANDFNIATLIRAANVFNVAGVTIVGKKRWDKRGAVGAHHYTPVTHRGDARAYYEELKASGTRIVAIDNLEGAVALADYQWPAGPVATVFGQEAIGVSNLALEYCDDVVYIPQRGSVRSLNVAACAAVILYDYVQRAPEIPASTAPDR